MNGPAAPKDPEKKRPYFYILKDKESINTSKLDISTIDDFIQVIYIRLYGNNPLAKYFIKKDESLYNKNGFEFKNFEIWRKK